MRPSFFLLGKLAFRQCSSANFSSTLLKTMAFRLTVHLELSYPAGVTRGSRAMSAAARHLPSWRLHAPTQIQFYGVVLSDSNTIRHQHEMVVNYLPGAGPYGGALRRGTWWRLALRLGPTRRLRLPWRARHTPLHSAKQYRLSLKVGLD